MHPVEWPPASGKHFSTCEDSLIPGAEVGFAICVCGTRKSQPLGTGGSPLVRAPTQILGTLKLFKSLLVCSGHIFQSRTTPGCSVHVQEKMWVMHGSTRYGCFSNYKDRVHVNLRHGHTMSNSATSVCTVSLILSFCISYLHFRDVVCASTSMH